MKRILAAALAALMILPFAACGKTEDPDDTAASQTAAETAEEGDSFFPDIEKQDYEGETFRILASGTGWYYAEEYQPSGQKVHVLNNVIYEMNTLVEEYLNIEIDLKAISGDAMYQTMSPLLMAGDDTYQLCSLFPHYDAPTFIIKNAVLDFNDMEYIDQDQPYWYADSMEQLSINGHRFIGVGEISKQHFHMIYCNKDMMTAANLTVPYDQVRNGKWTLDAIHSLTTGLYVDDGDGIRNNKDTYGFAGSWNSFGSCFAQSSGIMLLTKNDDDVFELSLYGDRLINMYDKLYTWTQDESTKIWAFAAPASEVVDFRNQQAYLTSGSLGTEYLDTDFSVGILPMPKYDVNQENYAHISWGQPLVIPNTVRNKEMVGQTMELMAYYTSTMVMDKYYDEVLQLRVSEAPDDRDMVELIYDTAVFDPGLTYCDGNDQLWNLLHITYFCILDGNANVTSYYQKNAKAAEKWLNKLFKDVK